MVGNTEPWNICNSTDKDFNWTNVANSTQYDPLCFVWVEMETVTDKVWFQGTLLAAAFGSLALFYFYLLSVFGIGFTIKTLFTPS